MNIKMTPIEKLQERVSILETEATQDRQNFASKITQTRQDYESKITQIRQDFESEVASLQAEVTQTRQDLDDAMNNWEQSEAQNMLYRQEVTELKESVEDLKFDLSIVKGVLTGSLKIVNAFMYRRSSEVVNNAREFLTNVSNNCKDVYEGAFGPTKKIEPFDK